ncbi:hypothetical protein NIES2104_46430 [Leptolyngbya sp. NIES-2104]|nr:hypothetical protein NIES2104_46430 [Leptolyngbya sp. NIES-2104]
MGKSGANPVLWRNCDERRSFESECQPEQVDEILCDPRR